MSDSTQRIAPRVCLTYALFGLLWILATDLLTAWWSADAREVIFVETVKGALFVGISAGLLYWYVRRQLRQQEDTNSALSVANAELRQQRDLLDSFINSLPGVAYVVDGEKRLRRWNRRFAEVTGFTPKELDRFDTRVLFTPEEAPIVQAGMMRAMTEGSASIEVNFIDRAGKPTPYYFTGVRAMLDGVPCMVGIGIDIAARKQRDSLLNGQKRVFEMIAVGAPLHETLDALLRLIESQSPDLLCSVLLLDADGVHLRHGAAPSLPESFIRSAHALPIGPNVGSCGTAVFRREPVIVENIATDPLWEAARELAAAHGLRACWSTPIFDAQQRVLGSFAIYYRTVARPNEHHLQLIDIATHTAAVAISKQEQEAALRESELRHRLLGEIIVSFAFAYRVQPDRRVELEWATEPMKDVIGYSEDDLKGKISFRSLIHPDDRAGQQAALDRVLGGHSEIMEFRLKTRSGHFRWLQCYNRPEWSEDEQRVVRIYGASQDITEHKRAEEALRDVGGRLHRLSQRLIEIQETERRHLARELHDEIGQALTATKLNLESLSREPEPAARTKRTTDSIAMVEHLLQTVRNLSLNLRPPMLDDLGLVAALRWLLDQHARTTGREVHFNHALTDDRFSSVIETACFRVAQEALTNITRHSKAQTVHVELRQDHGRLTLSVRDDGSGFNVAEARHRATHGGSLGLLGMEERVTFTGGQLSVTSSTEGGTELRAWFPLDPGQSVDTIPSP
jgi:PAS domain S-box-containing protein